MYKDKGKQREAQRKWVRHKRALAKGSTVTPEGPKVEVPTNYGLDDCQCRHCDINRGKSSKHILNHGAYKPVHELADNEINRVCIPDDIDYDGVCLQSKYDSRRISLMYTKQD